MEIAMTTPQEEARKKLAQLKGIPNGPSYILTGSDVQLCREEAARRRGGNLTYKTTSCPDDKELQGAIGEYVVHKIVDRPLTGWNFATQDDYRKAKLDGLLDVAPYEVRTTTVAQGHLILEEGDLNTWKLDISFVLVHLDNANAIRGTIVGSITPNEALAVATEDDFRRDNLGGDRPGLWIKQQHLHPL